MQKEGLGAEFVSFTFVTGGNGGDGTVILGWLIIKSIFMSCRIDAVFYLDLDENLNAKLTAFPWSIRYRISKHQKSVNLSDLEYLGSRSIQSWSIQADSNGTEIKTAWDFKINCWRHFGIILTTSLNFEIELTLTELILLESGLKPTD